MARKSLNRHISAPAEEPQINLTPLIDVVFVILIMFILVAPLLELDRIDLASAPTKSVDETVSIREQSPITIHVHKDNSISFNKRTISLNHLASELKEVRSYHPTARPQVFHDKEAFFGTYQGVKNAVEEAGFEAMDIILKPS